MTAEEKDQTMKDICRICKISEEDSMKRAAEWAKENPKEVAAYQSVRDRLGSKFPF